MRIATLGAGYADGCPRQSSGRGAAGFVAGLVSVGSGPGGFKY